MTEMLQEICCRSGSWISIAEPFSSSLKTNFYDSCLEKCYWCSVLTYTIKMAIMTSFNFAITSISVVKNVFTKEKMHLSNIPGAS